MILKMQRHLRLSISRRAALAPGARLPYYPACPVTTGQEDLDAC
jgi:hypothetical protein